MLFTAAELQQSTAGVKRHFDSDLVIGHQQSYLSGPQNKGHGIWHGFVGMIEDDEVARFSMICELYNATNQLIRSTPVTAGK